MRILQRVVFRSSSLCAGVFVTSLFFFLLKIDDFEISSLSFTVRPCAFFSMFLVTRKKKKKKTEDHKIRAVDRRCHERNTCTLHLQTRLSGCRNFFTVIAKRKKNSLLLRSWMEVDDRVNVSNHYSKNRDARHSCTFAKALKTP